VVSGGGGLLEFLAEVFVPGGVEAGAFAHLGFGFGEGEFADVGLLLALALEADALEVVVAAADAVDRADEGEDALLAALGDGLGEGGHEEAGEGEGLEFGATGGEGIVGLADVEILQVFEEADEGVAEGFLLHPVDVAAVAPFAEVLLGDGAALEVLGEDGLRFGLGVEPGEEGVGDFAVAEAVVEGFAEVVREAGDFAAPGGERELGRELR
jgi:hypothetical protein